MQIFPYIIFTFFQENSYFFKTFKKHFKICVSVSKLIFFLWTWIMPCILFQFLLSQIEIQTWHNWGSFFNTSHRKTVSAGCSELDIHPVTCHFPSLNWSKYKLETTEENSLHKFVMIFENCSWCCSELLYILNFAIIFFINLIGKQTWNNWGKLFT